MKFLFITLTSYFWNGLLAFDFKLLETEQMKLCNKNPRSCQKLIAHEKIQSGALI